jgi:HEAT repeat protein
LKPPPADLLKLLRFLAAEPPGPDDLPAPDTVKLVRKAFDGVEEATDGFVRGSGVFPGIEPEAAESERDALEQALNRFQKDPFSEQALNGLTEISSLIQNELDSDHVERVLPVTSVMVDLEVGSPNESVRRAYSIALKRLLTRANVERFVNMLTDGRYAAYAAMVVVRSGDVGLEILGDRLNQAEGPREATVYLSAITHFPDSESTLLSLLTHQYWHVVEGAVRLLGSLRSTNAIDKLEPLLKHANAKVRTATVQALGEIGGTAALTVLRRAIGSGDADLQATVAGGLKGRASGALAMPLVMAADEEKLRPEVRRELYLALGRIGTPDAVQALINAAEPGGRFLGRKSADRRLAAIEGLYLAGGPAVADMLETLAKDKDKAVRQAAAQALERLQQV